MKEGGKRLVQHSWTSLEFCAVSLFQTILLCKRVHVNTCGPNSKTTPLHIAAQLDQNNASICKMLVSRPCSTVLRPRATHCFKIQPTTRSLSPSDPLSRNIYDSLFTIVYSPFSTDRLWSTLYDHASIAQSLCLWSTFYWLSIAHPLWPFIAPSLLTVYGPLSTDRL